MNRFFLIFISALIIASCKEKKENGSISGTVLNNKNEPAAGAKISLLKSTNSLKDTTTVDQYGSYAFNYLEVEKYYLKVQKDNYQDTTLIITVEGGKTTIINIII